jgi:hypothetical protein
VRPDIVLHELYGDAAELLDVCRERLLIETEGVLQSPVDAYQQLQEGS